METPNSNSSFDLKQVLAKLRKTIQECFDKRLFESAIFFADKLVTMGNHQPEDVKK